MRTLATLTLAAAAALGLATASQARPVRMPEGRYTSFEAAGPALRATIPVREDTDSANAKNPALPSYAQAHGQETGGPARELIGR